MSQTAIREFCVLKYINGQQYVARAFGRYGLTDDISLAMRIKSDEADLARQIFVDEMRAQLKADNGVSQWVWDVNGGVVAPVRVSETLREIPDEAES